MCEENGGHLSLHFPWMSPSAGAASMLMFNTEICTVSKLLPGPLLQGNQLWCCIGLNITGRGASCLSCPLFATNIVIFLLVFILSLGQIVSRNHISVV